MQKLTNLQCGPVKMNNPPDCNDNDKTIPTICYKVLSDKINAGNSIVILDCRNEKEYHQSHIIDAVLLNNNPMMVKRFLKGTKQIADLLQVTTNADDIVEKMKNTLTVFYDTGKPQANIKNIIQNLIAKKMSISVLEGGFQEFHNKSPDLCIETNSESNDGESDQQAILLYSTAIATSEWERAAPAKILPHLILGNGIDSENKELLMKLKVGYIINATKHLTTKFENDFHYKKIEVSDTTGQDLSEYFQEAFDFIEIARKKGSVVFIHCHAGISRSVTITIAYMIKFYKMDLNQAYNFIKSRRPCVAPNLNFMGQLLTFEKEVRDEEIKTPVQAKQTIEIPYSPNIDRLSLVSKLISIPSIHLTSQCSEEEYTCIDTPKVSLDGKFIPNAFECIENKKLPLSDWKSLPPTPTRTETRSVEESTDQNKMDDSKNKNAYRSRMNSSHSDLEIVGKAIFPVCSPFSKSSTDLTLMGRRGSVAQIVNNYENQFKLDGIKSRH